MKYAREIKVGLLAIVCVFLVFFGFFFLKGVNIFSSVNAYHGVFVQVPGLSEQAPVLIRGYKVGQVDHIRYDFAKDSAFVVDISVDNEVLLPIGTQMMLVSNGLLGGAAIELSFPNKYDSGCYPKDAYLPTTIVPGIIDQVQSGLLGGVDTLLAEAHALVANVNSQLGGNKLQSSLENIEAISSDLTSVSAEMKDLMNTKVPMVVDNVDSVVNDLSIFSGQLKQIDLPSTMARVDTVVENANTLISSGVQSAVASADSLLTDLKKNPRRYVHFSLFGGKDKTDKAEKEKK